MKFLQKKAVITSIVAVVIFAATAPAVASHRVILFNEKAMEKVLDMWPDFVIAVIEFFLTRNSLVYHYFLRGRSSYLREPHRIYFD